MTFRKHLLRRFRSMSLATRLIAVPVVVIMTAALLTVAVWQLLSAPFWGVLLGVAVGGWLYVWTDLKLWGYRPILMILVGSEIAGRPIPVDGMSTIAMIVTHLALFAIFEPGQFRRHRQRPAPISA